MVINLDWKTMQPGGPGTAIVTTALDTALAHGQYLIKLRTGAAGGAPDSVKRLGGGPYTVVDNANSSAYTVGGYWTSDYLAACLDFETRLAAKYDGAPNLREKTMAWLAEGYAEPFRQYPPSGGGWTFHAFDTGMQSMLSHHKGVWKKTLLDLAYNPEGGIPGAAAGYTNSFMASARQTLGKQLVDGNNSIRSSMASGPTPSMYAKIRTLGPPIYFQTAAGSRIGDPIATYLWGASLGANSIELESGYQSLNETDLQAANAALIANPT